MVEITNLTREELTFAVRGKPVDGHPKTDSVPAGETKNVDVDEENDAQYQGRVLAGAISVKGAAAGKVASAHTETTGGKTK